MEFTEDKLLKLIREEAIKKIATDKKTDVEKFLKLQEQGRRVGSARRQVGYLGGAIVGAFQGKLNLNRDYIKSPGFRGLFESRYMDGNRGRASSGDNVDAALGALESEIDASVVGPYTHRAWELWVMTNYTAQMEARATSVYRGQPWSAGLSEIFEDSDQRLPSAAPNQSAVANQWEYSGRLLGWTIGVEDRLQGTSRSSTYHVQNAIEFMDQILADSPSGGFNPNMIALARIKSDQSAERRRRAEEESAADGTGPDVGIDVNDIQQSEVEGVVTRRDRETDRAYNDRILASSDYLRAVPRQFGLDIIPLKNNPAQIELGGLWDWDDGLTPGTPTQIYFLITAGDLPGPRGNRKMHPIISKGALDGLVTHMLSGFQYNVWSGIGGNVYAESVETWINLVRWLGGSDLGFGGGSFHSSSGTESNLAGRVGYDDNGQVYDALSYLLAKFKTRSSEIDDDHANQNIVTAASTIGEYKSSGDDISSRDAPEIQLLGSIIDRYSSSRNGRARISPSTVNGNPWIPSRAEARTEEIAAALPSTGNIDESASEQFNGKDIASLSKIISNTIKESFGVEAVARNTQRSSPTPSRRTPEPEAQVATPTPAPVANPMIFRRGAGPDTASIIKIQRFFNTSNTGQWSPDDDRAFIAYFQLYYEGRQKPALEPIMRREGWDGMTQFLSLNQIAGGFNSGPSGLLSFITDVEFFPSQRRRIRRFRRESS